MDCTEHRHGAWTVVTVHGYTQILKKKNRKHVNAEERKRTQGNAVYGDSKKQLHQ